MGTLRNYFGGFTNALRVARLPIREVDPLVREQALAQYLSLKNELGHTPTIAEVNSAAKIDRCPPYRILQTLGVLKQVREDRDRSRSDTCADCNAKKPIVMFLDESSQWVCQKCYRERTGKSQPKRGMCPRCNKGPQLISYRNPFTMGNICRSCRKQIARRKPTALRR